MPTDSSSDPSPSSPRTLTPVPGVLGPDEVATPSGYPDDPSAPPPSLDLVETASAPDGPSGFPDDPTAVPLSEPVLSTDRVPHSASASPPPPEPASEPTPTSTALVPVSTVEAAKEATRSRARDVGHLILRYAQRYWPERSSPAAAGSAEPPRLVGRIGQVLPYMKAIPWVLGGLFLLSFAWDFPGVRIALFGESISAEGLLRIVAVSGLIGFLTNWLAITMLFQPREKRAIIPQGLIPAQRERVIFRLSEAISKELINEEIIKQKIRESGVIGRYRDLALGTVRGVLEDADFRGELKTLTTDYAKDVLGSESVRKELTALAAQKVEEQAGQGLGGVALRLYRTFAEDDFQRRIDRAIADLPNAVAPLLDRLDDALDAIPEKVEARGDEIESWATKAVLSMVENFDVRTMIAEKARGFDEAQLENLLKSTSNEQLNYIKYLGGILGLFGGLVIWQPVLALVAFTVLGLSLWGVDEALVRTRKARA